MFRRRIEKLLEMTPTNTAVFVSSKANIFYYSGFTSEDAYLIITHDKKYIVTDSRYFIQAKEQAKDFELVDISIGYKEIFARIEGYNIAVEENNITFSELDKIKAVVSSDTEIIKFASQICMPRKIKDKNEIKAISEAERIGDEAFLYILDKIRPGASEEEIALELEFFMRKCGASSLSFETVVASGARSAMPHGTASKKLIENGDFVTLDFGCVFEGYCSDMTRTVVVGKGEQWQKEIYEIVLSAQMAALDALVVGKKCSDIDKIARDIIHTAGYGKNFGHGLGHSVGLQIHEMPSLSTRCNEIIENGHILTVEPGIYLEGKGGVRIEDLVAICDGNVQNLTKSPKELIIV